VQVVYLQYTVKELSNIMSSPYQTIIQQRQPSDVEIFHNVHPDVKPPCLSNPCMVLTHQNNVELLCYVQQVAEEEPKQRIGFIIDGHEIEE